jgi:hypothetical protein
MHLGTNSILLGVGAALALGCGGRAPTTGPEAGGGNPEAGADDGGGPDTASDSAAPSCPERIGGAMGVGR